jgi:hypothetical protein
VASAANSSARAAARPVGHERPRRQRVAHGVDGLEQQRDDIARGQPLEARRVVEHEPVRESRARDALDVGEVDVRAAGEQRRGAAGLGHRDRGARRAAVADHPPRALGAARRVGMAGRHEARDVARHRLGQVDRVDEREQPGQRRAVHHRRQRGRLPWRRSRRMRVSTGLGHRRHVELEQEAVELRLGQRIRPLELDGVLRGEHEEGQRQRVRLARARSRAAPAWPRAAPTASWARRG